METSRLVASRWVIVWAAVAWAMSCLCLLPALADQPDVSTFSANSRPEQATVSAPATYTGLGKERGDQSITPSHTTTAPGSASATQNSSAQGLSTQDLPVQAGPYRPKAHRWPPTDDASHNTPKQNPNQNWLWWIMGASTLAVLGLFSWIRSLKSM